MLGKQKTNIFLSMILALFLIFAVAGCSNDQSDSSGGTFSPGTYEGVGQGHNGEIKVAVEVDSEKILSIDVVEHSESEGIADPALERIPAEVVEGQTLDVDTVAGATKTSEGLIEAIGQAIEAAGGNIEDLQ